MGLSSTDGREGGGRILGYRNQGYKVARGPVETWVLVLHSVRAESRLPSSEST